MFQAACPSCGAPVAFRGPASVLAVCAYCRVTIAKEAAAVRDIGRMADLLEDYSPVQIGTTGIWEKRSYTVIGRRQLKYDRGLWSEWYVLFADGGAGWLGDFSGQFVMTVEVEPPADTPAFETVTPGCTLAYLGNQFRAADIRRVNCISAAGELPFSVEVGQVCPVIDWRSGKRFLTVDWTPGSPPRSYLGNAVTLSGMRCQFLRSAVDVARTAGRFRGAVHALQCPNCGASLKALAGVATHLVCGACHATIDASDSSAVVLEKHIKTSEVTTTYAPGDRALIGNQRWLVIGVLRQRETVAAGFSAWTEYLLYSPAKGLMWLVESDEGWERVMVLDEWPDPFPQEHATWQGLRLPRKWDFGAEVIHAAGAFTWRVKVGDRTSLVTYSTGHKSLTVETSASEMVLTLAERTSRAQIKAWFPKALNGHWSAEPQARAPEKPTAPPATTFDRLMIAGLATLVQVFLNVFLAIGSGQYWIIGIVVAISTVILWLPALME